MDKENSNKADNKKEEYSNNEAVNNPLCKDGVCKIPENNFKIENTSKDIMIDIDK